MAGKSTTKAPAKAPAKSEEKAAPAAATAAAEQLDNQPAATTDTAAPAGSAPAGATEQPASEAPGVDAGSIGQDAHPDTAPAAPDAAATTSHPAPAAPAAPVGGAAGTGGDTDQGDDGDIEGLWIVAIPEQGFRRCGFRFTREGFGIALDALTAAQIEQLENEPNLKVERGIFSGRVGERVE